MPDIHIVCQKDVSIHAPARGATCVDQRDSTRSHVSIHAPARGATIHIAIAFRIHIVSIHAPARGATKLQETIVSKLERFNPRAREGRDVMR